MADEDDLVEDETLNGDWVAGSAGAESSSSGGRLNAGVPARRPGSATGDAGGVLMEMVMSKAFFVYPRMICT